MISAMKRVMEKLQDENESLKRSTTSAKVTGNMYSYKPALNPNNKATCIHLQTYKLCLITEKFGSFQCKGDRLS